MVDPSRKAREECGWLIKRQAETTRVPVEQHYHYYLNSTQACIYDVITLQLPDCT